MPPLRGWVVASGYPTAGAEGYGMTPLRGWADNALPLNRAAQHLQDTVVPRANRRAIPVRTPALQLPANSHSLIMMTSDLDTPALLIDRPAMLRNIRRAQDYLSPHSIAFRPHIKTHKLPEVARLQVDAGACGITCAKLGEAEVLAQAGIRDIMVAYPVWGDGKLARLSQLAERVRLTVVFDSEAVARGMSSACSDAHVEVGALVETDTGMGRCGVSPETALVELCRLAQDLPGLRFQGIMTYQGYVTGSQEERVRQLEAENSRIGRVLERLAAAGLTCEVVSGGSTPNLFLSHLLTHLTENRCGTYVFNDRNTVHSGEVGWEDCAARVAATVVSTAVPGQAIIDGGSKTFSSDASGAGPGFGRVVEDPGILFAKMNEEHGYLKLAPTSPPRRVGDRLHVIPNHVCTCVNMHDRVWVHENGEVVDEWEIAARGRIL